MTTDWDSLAFDAHGNLVDLSAPVTAETWGPPPPIGWTPIEDLADIFGRRLCLMTRSGPIYDHRAASEVYESAGGWFVNVVAERQWWAWVSDDQRPPRIPRAVAWHTRHVWIESRIGRSQSEGS